MPTRQRIYEGIVRTPGIHFRRLARELAMPIGTLEHHLRLLERHGVVVAHVEARRRSLYAAEDHTTSDLPILHCLRHRTWRRILISLLEEPGLALQDIRERVPMAPSTLAYHLGRLLHQGLLERIRVGRVAVFEIREPDRIMRLLRTYGTTYRGLSESWLFQTPEPSTVFAFLLARIPPGPAPKPNPAVGATARDEPTAAMVERSARAT